MQLGWVDSDFESSQGWLAKTTVTHTVYHPFGGRCFVCFVLDPASAHGPKTKHTKHLPQADELRSTCVCESAELKGENSAGSDKYFCTFFVEQEKKR